MGLSKRVKVQRLRIGFALNLYLVSKLKPKPGVVASSLLVFYGLFRFSVEFFREPDAHLGYLTFNLSMGQILSLPMIIIGIILVLFFSNKYAKLS